MRRDKLERTVARVHWTTPRFFKRCRECKDDVKGEQMWWMRVDSGGCAFKQWACFKCCPRMFDFLKANSCHLAYGLDLSPLLDDAGNHAFDN